MRLLVRASARFARFARYERSTAFAATLFVSSSALAAAEDCPPGSVAKAENGFTWCEPTVCENDGQCKQDEVCRGIPLCMQVGAIAGDASSPDAASKKLVVTQKCAPDKTCPQATTCSDMKRCVTKLAADRMGILTAPSASAAPTATEAKKSSCGCDVVGTHASAGALFVAFGLSAMFAARRRGSRPQR